MRWDKKRCSHCTLLLSDFYVIGLVALLPFWAAGNDSIDTSMRNRNFNWRRGCWSDWCRAIFIYFLFSFHHYHLSSIHQILFFFLQFCAAYGKRLFRAIDVIKTQDFRFKNRQFIRDGEKKRVITMWHFIKHKLTEEMMRENHWNSCNNNRHDKAIKYDVNFWMSFAIASPFKLSVSNDVMC